MLPPPLLARGVRAGAFFAAAVFMLLLAQPAFAQGRPSSAPTGPIGPELGWLAGCWAATLPSGALYEEWWMPEAGDLLVGMSRVSRDGRVLSFEFLRIRRQEGRTFYIAQPGGGEATTFELVATTDGRLVFENLDHDFPQRILYAQPGTGHPFARIEGEQGGTLRTAEFPLQRVDCPGSGVVHRSAGSGKLAPDRSATQMP